MKRKPILLFKTPLNAVIFCCMITQGSKTLAEAKKFAVPAFITVIYIETFITDSPKDIINEYPNLNFDEVISFMEKNIGIRGKKF